MPNNYRPFTTTVLGTPRIGPNRELKRAVEGYWAGRVAAAELAETAAGLRRDTWTRLKDNGFDSIPVNTFSFYDQVLDTAVMLDALPARVAAIADPLDRYFAAARGNADVTPLEMTKWFDTNYHYLVPEIGPDTVFTLRPEKILAEVAQAHALGIPARPVVVGPITFLTLAKAVDGAAAPITRIDDVLPAYFELLDHLVDAGVEWVQFDEPSLVTDAINGLPELAEAVYGRLSAVTRRPALLVATYFGDPGSALGALARTGVEGIAVDLVEGDVAAVAAVPELANKLVVAGVVDGRNIWRTDLDHALGTLATLLGSAGSLAVSTSCSTLHVPYSLEPETGLDDNLRGWLAFADEKYTEVSVLAKALRDGRESRAAAFDASRAALATRVTDPRLHNEEVRSRLAAITDADVTRGEASTRLDRQQAKLGLPALPTTTIGSYPQTSAIRIARAALRKGEIDEAAYVEKMRAEIADVIALQEKIGLDVLVHGEPERNDMVQYFAEQLDGFVATANGWVQSYGTRCVRPPILYGDVVRPQAMTVEWISYAQSLTGKPVKGMLTGPVTILAWSFVRNDQSLADSANQIALAIRDETVDLERSGAAIIQVDEPALRELLPLRDADKPAYLNWAVRAFRLSTSGVADDTQIHTHLCYSEFGEVIGAIAALDADVTSIEAARSKMEVLDDLNAAGFANGVGPGVYDIHSPRVPCTAEIAESLSAAIKAIDPKRLWVNPDCGLKTRGADEVVASLTNLVEATQQVRAGL
ncbi:5-methyltetrahydropteroyltriglutamate--homocysteine S-methyltransferase [Gordonia amarae]|uniref:5-methyltetrahydropteroyltriglutamate--homocysteine methyltransferase n=2 Tax=Gordonia amarae TaxID=36821 RepID=G7GR76_9ACTN|nr:5-methyltetrahydropteroyltriglutamate--homocysteine S-methyltransferase [Gordonia amarae]MCS3878337.1 5-methyltetrahydropteroyltriglutamate--homocysteine methyltransferase [Gordonia amarae]QHN16981.1 5-methyltetrahydropteroyltriglutamate--homocysteine S-methyltransferase [Gordonia amarae]QHN21507.1 5-methyltetrahydropteroyltriglutamate--homocysteine S-methyltransferase [Gordonia amarae]QHN30357.1 5-methyltetrahydropteroyltriglutamate--homocysteine S-methyltransferase [Gordonia amarae]QHN391